MRQHYEEIIFTLIFPMLYFRPEDEELFKENPVEYFRKNEQNAMNYTLASEAIMLMTRYSRHKNEQGGKGKKYIFQMLVFINNFLSSGKNPRNPEEALNVINKEALFHMLDGLSDEIDKIKDTDQDIANLVRDFVVPELCNEHGFMRMRACILIQKYTRDAFDLELLKNIANGVTQCLKDVDNLPVRSNAAKALEVLLRKPELAQHFLPHLQEILTTYLQLINEFENESLIQSLKNIFETYSDVIGPYAYDLVNNLSELFMKLYEKEQK